MIKRRFYKLEHGDKDSGSDSSCFSSDSDPEIEESEDSESESEDTLAQVSEEDDDDSGEEEESPAAGVESDADDEDEDDDGFRGKIKTNRDFHLEEPPEEEEENYILGCMLKINKVYKCRFCPSIVCLNEISMEAHVASKKHAYLEKKWKEENLGSDDDEEVDDAEKPTQVKGNRRSQRKGKKSTKKLKTDDDEVDKSEKPSLLIKGNRKARRQGLKPQNLEKVNIQGSKTTQRESAGALQKSRKKRRQTKD